MERFLSNAVVCPESEHTLVLRGLLDDLIIITSKTVCDLLLTTGFLGSILWITCVISYLLKLTCIPSTSHVAVSRVLQCSTLFLCLPHYRLETWLVCVYAQVIIVPINITVVLASFSSASVVGVAVCNTTLISVCKACSVLWKLTAAF